MANQSASAFCHHWLGQPLALRRPSPTLLVRRLVHDVVAPHLGCPAGRPLLRGDRHDDLAADGRIAIVQLQIFTEVLVAGGHTVAGGEGEAVDAYQITAAARRSAAGSAAPQGGKEEGAQRVLHCNFPF